MILSMTGYGKSEFELHNEKFSVEIKSLNSKNADINCKITFALRSEEINIRNIIKNKLFRGKIDFGIFRDVDNSETSKTINKEVVLAHYNDIKELVNETKENVNPLEIALNMPDVLCTDNKDMDENTLAIMYKAIDIAIESNLKFRKDEGEAIGKDMLSKVSIIENLIPEVEKYEEERIENVRQRLKNAFADSEKDIELDKNRFEQELIFYLEKFDVNEEKQRLKQHCEYFKQIVNNDEILKGKKLAFISQEIGREINTLGSKANNSAMQKIVIQMKDELEKIKEQSLNVL
jgi:uncharacterized protein (TIGR00255 family)